MNVTPFKFTAEDLADLDKKTRDGLQPLLDALNTTMQQLVAAAAAMRPEKSVESSFESSPAGTAYVFVNAAPITKPRSLIIDQLRLTDGSPMTSVWGYSWQMTSGGLRLTFGGLDPSLKYTVALTIK